MGLPPNKNFRRVALLAALALGAGLAYRVYWTRTRRAPALLDAGAATAVLLESARKDAFPPDPEFGSPGFPPALVRWALDAATAKAFYPRAGDGSVCYDPDLLLRAQANTEVSNRLPEFQWVHRTNSLGMSEDREPSALRPDLRVLVTGASNVYGLCANEDSATHVLEALLAERRPGKTVEALNTGCGYYNFFNYLAVLERYRELRPDVFVLIAYGGNDFFSGLKLWRHFRGLGPPQQPAHALEPLLQHADAFSRLVVGTELGQVVYLLSNPADVERAVACACSLTAEIERLCAADGIRLVLAYLPPPLAGQPELMERVRADAIALLGIPPASIELSDRIADRWLEYAASRGLPACDLRPAFRASKERLYYLSDTHINVAGQRLVAATLLPFVEAAAALR